MNDDTPYQTTVPLVVLGKGRFRIETFSDESAPQDVAQESRSTAFAP